MSAAGATVGRVQELAQVADVLEEVAGGGLRCVAVQGEPGIGKTRLLRDLRELADRAGHLVLSGSGSELEDGVSFGVWVDALDTYVASLELDRSAAGEDDEFLRQLAGVFPSLGGLAGPGQLADERYRAHRAVGDLLERLATPNGLVVVLDDVHWADGASVELLGTLLRRRSAAPILLALGFRANQISERLAAMLISPLVTTVTLTALGRDDAVLLAGTDLDAETFDAIFRASGGNPFYIEQLARSGTAGITKAGDLAGVPATVAAAIVGELLGLSPEARRLLEGGAVAGDPFDPVLAGAIAELDQDTAISATDELLDRALISTTDVPYLFRFRHPLVRRAVYESTKAGWRIAAHRRAAEELLARGTALGTCAHHIQYSAAPGDTTAIARLLDAGRATAPRAPASAVRWYEAALRLMPDTDAGARIGALAELAAAQRTLGDLQATHGTLNTALELIGSSNEPLRLMLTSALAAAETFLGRLNQARSRLQAALASLEDQASAPAIRILLDFSLVSFFAMDLTALGDSSSRALAAARAQDDPGITCLALATRAMHAGLTGDTALAEALDSEATALLATLSDAQLALNISAINTLGWAQHHSGRCAKAVATGRRGIDIARASGQGQYLELLNELIALSYVVLGDLDAAEASRRDALEAARLNTNPHLTGTALMVSSQVHFWRGEIKLAREEIEEAVGFLDDVDPGIVAGLTRSWLALLLLDAGSPERADATVEPVGGWDMPLAPPGPRIVYQEIRTALEIRAGRLDVAEAAARRAEAAAAELATPAAASLAGRARARVQLATGDPGGAVTTAMAAAQHAIDADARGNAGPAWLVAGQALAAQGRRDEAVRVLRQAEIELDRNGQLPYRAEARRELRRFGARVEARGPASGADGGVAALSKRELEIATLVTRRLTNREIATGLFLSEKTVETHLRNIFAKLGVSSRVEVARALDAAESER